MHLVYVCICYYLGDWNRLNTQIFKLSPGSTECTSLTADTSGMLRLDLKTKWVNSSKSQFTNIFTFSLAFYNTSEGSRKKAKLQCKCMCKSKVFISNIALKKFQMFIADKQ